MTIFQISTNCKTCICSFFTKSLLKLTGHSTQTLSAMSTFRTAVTASVAVGIGLIIRMSLRALGFGLIVGPPSPTTAVFTMSNCLQMGRILASSMQTLRAAWASFVYVVASVVNFHSFRDGSISQFICKCMPVSYLKDGIAVFIYSSQPRPALVWVSLVNLWPIEVLFGHSRKSITHVSIVT